MAEVEVRLRAFEENIFGNPEIFDPVGVHHEFSQGRHGRKIDMSKIDRNSELYDEWVYLTAEHISRSYADEMPDAIVGIADGTNDLAHDVRDELGGGILCLETYKKKEDGLPRLRMDSLRQIIEYGPVFAVEVEDVGTTGRNTIRPALQLISQGVERVEVVHAVQRSETLPYLDEAGIAYSALIKRLEPSYTAQVCHDSPEGYCSQGWRFIPYGK
jgi:hypothetical protein